MDDTKMKIKTLLVLLLIIGLLQWTPYLVPLSDPSLLIKSSVGRPKNLVWTKQYLPGHTISVPPLDEQYNCMSTIFLVS